MSQTFASGLIIIVVQVLAYLGVKIGTVELTTTVTTLVTVASGLWVLVRRYQQGGINKLGKRV